MINWEEEFKKAKRSPVFWLTYIQISILEFYYKIKYLLNSRKGD